MRGLTVGYPTSADALKTVIECVTLDVRRGEILGPGRRVRVGQDADRVRPSWACSRAARMVESGAIVHDGTDLLADGGRTQRGLLGRRIAYVPQEPMSNLDPYFTVGHQLVAPLRKHLGISRAEARDRATELLARVGIPDPARTMRAYPHEISGGMAQRVLIAGAVSCDPDLIVADEPTTALDVTVQAEILDLLRSLQAERGLSMVLVTHNFGVVADLCDSVVVLRGGQVVEQGTAAGLLSAPQHPYTRDLLAATLDGTAPRSVSDAAFAELEAAR